MKEKNQRPDWDEYFLGMLPSIAARATCDRGRSGCVIVKDKRVLTTGYVGAPPKMDDCDKVGHLIWTVIDDRGQESKHCVRTIHAEANAIYQAAKFGISLEGSTLYCKMEPCYNCAMAILSVGIKRVVCQKKYQKAQRTREYFKKAGIELVVVEDEVQKYE